MDKLIKYAAPITAVAGAVGAVAHTWHAALVMGADVASRGEHQWLQAVGNIALILAVVAVAVLLAYLRKKHLDVAKEVDDLGKVVKSVKGVLDDIAGLKTEIDALKALVADLKQTQ